MQPSDAISGRQTDAKACLWDRYVAHMPVHGVTPTAVRWSVIRAEHSLRTVAHQRRADHTPQEVTDDLETLGRAGRMTEWHSRQTVEAIPHGLRIAAVAWAQQLDWASWKASA